MSVLCLVVLQPVDVLLPPMPNNVPNKSQVIKGFHVLFTKFAFGSCNSSLVNPKSKFKAVRSDIIGGHKHMSVLCFVLLQPVDTSLPQVIKYIPNKSQFVKTVDLLLAKLAFGLCHAFLADPKAKFKTVMSLIMHWHKHMSMSTVEFCKLSHTLLPPVSRHGPHELQAMQELHLNVTENSFLACFTHPFHPQTKFESSKRASLWHHNMPMQFFEQAELPHSSIPLVLASSHSQNPRKNGHAQHACNIFSCWNLPGCCWQGIGQNSHASIASNVTGRQRPLKGRIRDCQFTQQPAQLDIFHQGFIFALDKGWGNDQSLGLCDRATLQTPLTQVLDRHVQHKSSAKYKVVPSAELSESFSKL